MYVYEYLVYRVSPTNVEYDPYNTIAINTSRQGMTRTFEEAVEKAKAASYTTERRDNKLVIIKHNDSPKYIFDKDSGLSNMSDYDFVSKLDEFSTKIQYYYDIVRDKITNIKHFIDAAECPILVNVTPEYYSLYRHIHTGSKIRDVNTGTIHEVLAKLHEEPLDPLQFFNYTPMMYIDDPNCKKLVKIDNDSNNPNYERVHKYLHSIETNEMWRFELCE